MSKYKCVIFDCDGVLVDSEPLSNQVMVDMANEYCATIDISYAYRNFKGHALQDCVLKIERLINKKLPSSFEDEYRARSYEKFKNEIQPIDGVLKLIKKLTIPYCVASSGPEHKIKLNLELTGLLPYFEGKIFSCYTIKKWKPESDVFLWAAKTMGFQPKDCLVIEDSITGVHAALAGGFDVFGFIAHDYNNELKAESIKTFKSFGQLLI